MRRKARRSGVGSYSSSWVFYVLLLAIALCPLPFGSVYQWSWAGLAIIVGILLLISFALDVLKPSVVSLELSRLWLPGFFYLLAVIWLAFQASGMSPRAWHHPIWQQIAETPGAEAAGYISLNPYDTWSEFLKMLTYAGIFWLAATHARNRKRAWAALWILGAVGAFYAVFGVFSLLSDLGDFLWYYEGFKHIGVTSTFFNRNMYAVYAAFGFLSITCLILDPWLSHSQNSGVGSRPWTRFVRGPQSSTFASTILALVVLTALIMTGSRGGIFALMVAATVLFLCLALRRGSAPSRRRPLFRIAAIFMVFGGVMFVLAGAHLGSRLADIPSGIGAGRLAGYEIILSAIAEAPLMGFGGASSKDVFYLHNEGTFWKTFNYAHNLYLGAAVEMGIPAAFAMITAVVLVTVRCLKGIWRRQRDLVFPALGVSVTVLVAVHGLVDSPLYIPANAATYSFLLGLAYAQSWPTRASPSSSEAAEQPLSNALPPSE